MGVRVPSRRDVPLTPRVIDQASLDDPAASLRELIEHADTLDRLVESAEVNIAVLAHKTAQSASRVETRAAELAELLARGEQGQHPETRSEETPETVGGTRSEADL